MPDRKAQVWYEDQLVGTLREQDRELYLTYCDDWLNNDEAFPISISLPLSGKEQYAHTFFSGLLPEAKVRIRICREQGIDKDDDVGLLFAIGEDCAGALSIVIDRLATDNNDPEPLSTDQIKALVRSKGEITLGDQRERRFSLAGAQEKQPVIFYKGEEYALPNQNHPSTHILKFETYPRVCVAEAIANIIASKLSMSVVNTEYFSASTDTELPFLRIARYDRTPNGEKIRRLHQEDTLQAIGEPTAVKYEADGGPNLGQIAEMLRQHVSDPANTILRLRDWQIFNFLVGNWDGHAKNLALLYQRGSNAPVLAPFYDLVAIEFLNAISPGAWSRKLAFKIGGEDEPERVGLENWNNFSASLGIPPKPTIQRLGEFAELLPVVTSQARDEFSKLHGDHQVYDQLERYILMRSEWVKGQLPRQ